MCRISLLGSCWDNFNIYVYMHIYIYMRASHGYLHPAPQRVGSVFWQARRMHGYTYTYINNIYTHTYIWRCRLSSPANLTHQGIFVRNTGPVGPGPSGPRGDHRGPAHKGPGGPTRARPARAQGCARAQGACKGPAHKGPGVPTRARPTRPQGGPQRPRGHARARPTRA